MKRFLFSAISILVACGAVAQTSGSLKKGQYLGIQFNLYDFPTAKEARTSGLNTVLAKESWLKMDRKKIGFSVGYTTGLNDNVDLASRFGYAALENAMTQKNNGLGYQSYFELESALNVKLLTDKHLVSPFLILGAGAATWGGYYAAYIPTGAGFQVNLFDENLIVLQTQYRLPVTANANHHLFYSLGIFTTLGK